MNERDVFVSPVRGNEYVKSCGKVNVPPSSLALASSAISWQVLHRKHHTDSPAFTPPFRPPPKIRALKFKSTL